MKTVLLTTLFSVFTLISFSQDPNYTVNGNLGIGTVPTHKLSVDGDSKMTGELTVTEKAKLEGEVEMTGDVKLTGLSTIGTGFDNLLYLDDNGKIQKVDPLMIDKILTDIYLDRGCSGLNSAYQPIWTNNFNKLYVHNDCGFNLKVGVGTSNPTARLHVSGNENGYQLKIQGQTAYSKSFTINTNNIDCFSIKGDGQLKTLANMGVGADANDDVQLLVKSEASKPVGICLNSLDVLDNTYGLKILSNNVNVKAIAVNDSELGGDDVFRVMGNGKVFATEISVRLKENFPDYVFEDDYKLMSLHDLEEYIKTNKRLPNMPSADKVATDGLDLGDNNRLLTEKVEELTLYVLQLKAEIDALKVKTEANQQAKK